MRAGAAVSRSGARPLRWRDRVAGRSWLVWAAAATLVVGAVVLFAAVQLLKSEQKLSRARTALLAAEAAVRDGQLGRARERMAAATRDISAANLTLHNDRALTLVSYVPVARQNVLALRRSVGLLLEMADGGRSLLDAAKPLEDPTGRVSVPLRNGAVPLDVVLALRDRLDDFTFSLPGPTEEPGSALLIGPVGDLQHKVYTEAARRRHEFTSVAGALDLLGDMSGGNGPRHYLLAVANAAEMRGTGGMILSYGVLSSDKGSFTLDRFGSVDEIKLSRPADVNPEPGYVKRFSEFSPTLFWRTANLGADYLQVAPVMASMYQTATGQPVDGVIQIDSMGLSDLLRGIGPVSIPDLGEVNADNAVALTLNEAYTRFPDRPVRQEYLGQIAEAAFRKLLTGDYPSLKGLAASLTQAANRRNVIFWSSKASGERPAAHLHADGALPDSPDFAGLTVQNLTGNKLDYYLDTALRLEGQRPEGKLGHIKATVVLGNTAPKNGRPVYIFGPAFPRFQSGQYEGLVNLYVPQGTSVTASSGLDQPGSLAVAGEDDRTVVSFRTSLQAGETRTVTIDLTLTPRPPGNYQLDLLPFPRVRPTVLTVDVDAAGAHRRFSGPLLTPTTVP